MNDHHLILGSLVDYITGKTIDDTHDERYRQKIARFLVKDKNFLKTDLVPNVKLNVRAGKKSAVIKIDYIVNISGRPAMLIKYGPGSIVTRRRSAAAMSMLMTDYQIPVVVVTNGEDAEVLDAFEGKNVKRGFEMIPSKKRLETVVAGLRPELLSERQKEMASRIVYVFEVDGSCPCDSDICRIPEDDAGLS